MNTVADESHSVSIGVPARAVRARHMVSPAVDFLCLGGGSLFMLAPLALIQPTSENFAALVMVSLAVANLINHPHFAASYVIFYRGFSEKAFTPNADPWFRARYLAAGLVVPIVLAAFYVTVFLHGDARKMTLAASLMLLLVGWHYVKQGYGMLIVGSVLEQKFLDKHEKNSFLLNAYTCWFTYWLGANWMVAERNLWGLRHYMIDVPTPLLTVSSLAAACTTILAVGTVIRRIREGRGMPFNGTVAYFTTLYVWLSLLLNPFFALLIPAFHSLQYLIVVWRFERNRSACETTANVDENSQLAPFSGAPKMRQAIFWISCGILGYLGFWGVPELLDSLAIERADAFSGEVFLFMFWTFINIHHYFLDNVMWRKENKETAKHLFH